MRILGSLSHLGSKVADHLLPDKSALRDAQARINEQEVNRGPGLAFAVMAGGLDAVAVVRLGSGGASDYRDLLTGTLLPPVLGEISTMLLGICGSQGNRHMAHLQPQAQARFFAFQWRVGNFDGSCLPEEK